MNKQSNSYIILYATALVVVVALALSFTAIKLQPLQNANIETEKKAAILGSVDLLGEAASAKDKNEYVAERYSQYIVEDYLVNVAGERVDGDAFEILNDLKGEYEKPEAERRLPVFVSRDDSGNDHFIIPVTGSGLWGPVWGYVALEKDWNTIYGVSLDHKGETPGLGAEIATPSYMDQYKGKQIFDGEKFVGIYVLKGAGSSAGNPHAVDAITGGTITSRAVETMFLSCLSDYQNYFRRQAAGTVSAPASSMENLEGEDAPEKVETAN